MVPEFRDFAVAELHLQQQRYRTRADRFRDAALDAHQNWRLGCVSVPRSNWSHSREAELFRSGIAEIAALRLRIAYMPLFQGIERIAARAGILADLRADPYAPPRRGE